MTAAFKQPCRVCGWLCHPTEDELCEACREERAYGVTLPEPEVPHAEAK